MQNVCVLYIYFIFNDVHVCVSDVGEFPYMGLPTEVRGHEFTESQFQAAVNY